MNTITMEDIGTMPYVQRLLRFISDPGHGWLRVPRRIFDLVGSEASSCSYVDRNFIYLEEDCDAPAFDRKISAMFGWDTREFVDGIRYESSDEYSSIRHLAHW